MLAIAICFLEVDTQVTLKFWWHLFFLESVVKRTLLFMENDSDSTFISINCLEYITIIINYCAALVVFDSRKVNDDPHPVVLCVTDNTSALNWTLHTSKKSIIRQVLARFFCGLLIGSNLGVNAKWISSLKNILADKISRLKRADNNPLPPTSYDYSKFQQAH